jgi:hypothetical protein
MEALVEARVDSCRRAKIGALIDMIESKADRDPCLSNGCMARITWDERIEAEEDVPQLPFSSSEDLPPHNAGERERHKITDQSTYILTAFRNRKCTKINRPSEHDLRVLVYSNLRVKLLYKFCLSNIIYNKLSNR